MISNEDILSTEKSGPWVEFHLFYEKKFLGTSKYSQPHCLIFLYGSLIILLLIILESLLLKFVSKHLKCAKKTKDAFSNKDAISNDFYDEIQMRFLIREYERVKAQNEELQEYIDHKIED